MFQKITIHDIGVNVSDYPTALTEVETLLALGGHHYACFLEANLFSQSRSNPVLPEIFNRAALVYPDGIAIRKSIYYRHGLDAPRVSGPTFLLKAVEYGVARGWKHFFYGGAEGVAEQLAQKLRQQFPGALVAGTYCPPFRALSEAEESEIKQMIEDSGADLVWVGLGGPKQELWMNAHLGKIKVPVMLGVGAAFDFHSGARPWAPKAIRKLGLEWLFRMFSGGRRTFVRNLKCVTRVAGILGVDLLCGRMPGRRKTGKPQNSFPAELSEFCRECGKSSCQESLPRCIHDRRPDKRTSS